MAIRHWSGRRLAGTWMAGAAAEVVVFAAPIAFFIVSGFTDVPAKDHYVYEVPEVASGRAAVEAKRELAAAKIAELEGNKAEAVRGFRSAPISSSWYALPLAGAVAFYLLAIPVGLVAITIVWLITRMSGSPPPSA